MELASNIVGILLVLMLVGIWYAHVVQTRPYLRVHALISAVAVVCAISFLFPAVSFTDDLRAEPPLVMKAADVDYSGQKWKPARDNFRRWQRPPVAARSGFFFASLDAVFLSPNTPEPPVFCSTPRGALQGRSPPTRLNP